jgi:hypothetical protein
VPAGTVVEPQPQGESAGGQGEFPPAVAGQQVAEVVAPPQLVLASTEHRVQVTEQFGGDELLRQGRGQWSGCLRQLVVPDPHWAPRGLSRFPSTLR